MKQRLLLAACATVLIAACSDGDQTGSDNPTAPGIVAFAPLSQPPGCSFKTAQDLAKAYFKLNTDKGTARTYLRTAEGAGEGTIERDNALFDVLEMIANLHDDNTKTNLPLDGAKLVNEVFECGGGDWDMSDGRGFSPTSPAYEVWANALTPGQGGFAVVGTGIPTNDYIGDANSEFVETDDGVFAFGFNDYNSASDSWEDTFGRAVVILANVGNQPFGLPIVTGVGYRVNLIFAEVPADWPDDQLAAEFCSAGAVDLFTIPEQARHRVGRQSSDGDAALQQGNINGYCPEHNVMNEAVPGATRPSLLARMVDQVIGFFRPAPLQAMMFVPPWSGSSGGQGTSFSDGGFYSDYVITDVVTVHTTVPSVPDQNINSDINLSISVCGRAAPAPSPVPACGQAGDVALENATVTLKVIGNFGTPIVLSGDGCGLEGNLACALQTDENGTVSFVVQLNKTGSYTFEVRTDFPPHNLVAMTNQFIVRP